MFSLIKRKMFNDSYVFNPVNVTTLIISIPLNIEKNGFSLLIFIRYEKMHNLFTINLIFTSTIYIGDEFLIRIISILLCWIIICISTSKYSIRNSGISVFNCHRVEDADSEMYFTTKIFIFVVPDGVDKFDS